MKKVVSKDYLTDALDLPYNTRIIRQKTIVDTSRWSIQYELVFEDEGKFWKTTYSEGATECQDESPWEYEDEVTLEEVEEVETVIKVWKAVK